MRRLLPFLAALLFASAAYAQSLPSPQLRFTPSGTGAAARTVDEKLKDLVNARDFGVSPGNADDTAKMQAAIDAVATAGGGAIILPAGTINVAGVVLKSNVYLRGQGRGQTVLKLKNSANVDVLFGQNAYSLFGTLSASGVFDWGLSDLTIDGNRANNTSGNCLAVYGYRYTIENVVFQNCPEYGIRSEGGQPISASMEANLRNILIDTTGKHGAYFNGPHDSNFDNFIVIDAGQSANNSWDGVYFDTYMNARIRGFHGWHRSSVTNRVLAQFYDNAGASNFSLSHFEGAWTANLILAGQNTSLDSSNMYYAAWNGLNVVIRGPGNTLKGTLMAPGAGQPDSIGVTLGFGSDNASANLVDVNVWSNAAGAVDFTHSAGNNRVRVNGYQSTGPKYVGVPAASDDVELMMPGGATGNDLRQKPNSNIALSDGWALTWGNTYISGNNAGNVNVIANGGQVAAFKWTGAVNFPPRAAPASPVEGDCYWDTTAHKLKCWDGSLWQAAW